MALKLKKEIKKSSYYVWFLGAKESKGLRGLDYIRPVIGNLEEREKDIEPFKVTLQVSSKGLKIVQNIVSSTNNKKPKNETIKHFIPHNTITCVHQKDDIIACILLLFNPVTKCPLHVHAYRCDSLETATMLKAQLQVLIDKPENQKKFAEIEARLMPEKKEKKERLDSSIGSSDTGTSTKSESSEERFSSDARVATLYDSVAAELRAKLNKNDVPILLPPRDYDTVHRQKGNLTGIELRRCLNVNIVGQNVKAKRMASSGGSSGIGSDHAPSPESPDVQERYHDGHSTSDEDWNADQDTGLYLIDQPTYPSPLPKYDYRAEQRKPRQFDQNVTRKHLEEHIRKKLEQRNKYHGQESFNYREETPPNNSNYRNERNHNRSSLKPLSQDYKDYNKDYNVNKDYNKEYSKDYNKEYTKDYNNKDDSRFSYEMGIQEQDTMKRVRGKSSKEGRTSREGRYPAMEPELGPQISMREKDFTEMVNRKNLERYHRDSSPGLVSYEDNFSVLQVSPRERFNDAKEKFLQLEKRTGPPEFLLREVPISPNICNKDKRNSRYYDEEPIPAPRNFKSAIEDTRRTNSREAPTPLERYRQQKGDKYEMKRRSMFNLSSSSSPQHNGPDYEYAKDYYPEESRTLGKDVHRRSFMEQGHARGRDSRDSRDIRESRHPRDVKRSESRELNKYCNDWDNNREMIRESRDGKESRESHRDVREQNNERDVFRDGRDGLRDGNIQMREKKFAQNQRYRNSYAEPSTHGLENRKFSGVSNGRTRYDILHRTNSTVSNNGRVGIASVHPY